MNKLLSILILLCLFSKVEAQVKHEFKMPVFNMIVLDFQPTYEIISKKERIGLEIGGGFDLGKTRLSRSDTIAFGGDFDKYKTRIFKSSLALKFYASRLYNSFRIGFFIGPFVEFDKATFYEEEYLLRQQKRVVDNPFYSVNYIGQREIRPGVKSGLKLGYKDKIVLDLSLRLGWYFDEQTKGKIVYKPKFNFLWPAVKIGYRFGGKDEFAELK